MPAENDTKIPVSEGMEGEEDLTESVEELRSKLETMKKLLAENQQQHRGYQNGINGTNEQYRYHPPARYESLIDGNFLSVVFAVVFLLIVGVSFYAFQNLYFAVLKKFPARHSEL